MCACAALAQPSDLAPIRIVRQQIIPLDVAESSVKSTHGLRLTLAVLRDSGWAPSQVIDATRRATAILAQCAIRTDRIEMNEIEAAPRYRSVFTPVSRELAGRLSLSKPTLFFLADTRNEPAFDAEAVGRGNSRTRPEMTDTVWVALGARDLPVALAHELAHVLADSGEHSNAPGNLMREDTAADGIALTDAQCNSIRDKGAANGLLRPLP